ncbi:MAG: M48 family metalloprotease [Bacteroidetes bacterium]|nr:M48 family metalloprotease [Bacteroidota bacterium]
MKSFFSILAGFLLSFNLFSQDFADYSPLDCVGDIPDIFTTPSSEKYKAELAEIARNGVSHSEMATMDQFALETNFVIDDMLQSGIVLFNDEVSQYLNDIMSVLLENEPELQDVVNVYTLRTENVNAFATSRGSIFVTLGLISQLENEAQLAYILAHELVHVREQHLLNLYLKSAALERGSQDLVKESGLSESILSENHYSKEVEMEADIFGLERFLSTNYSYSTLNTVFDVFKYAYLPFDEVPFDASIFEDEYYQFPEKFFKEELDPITGTDEDADDSESTHPNIGTRRKALREALEGKSDEGRTNYLVSEERFFRVREIARFELPMLYLQAEALALTIYTGNILLQKYPGNKYLRKTVGKALYVHSKYSNDEDYYYESNYKEVEGESQQAHYFMKRLRRDEATILALRYNWRIMQENPDDDEVRSLVEDLFIELGFQRKGLEEFNFDEKMLQEVFSGDESESESGDEDESEDGDENLSKYDKIRGKKAETVKPGKTEYWRLAFLEEMKDETFEAAFEAGLEEANEREKEREFYQTYEGQRAWKTRQKTAKKKGLQLGIDKVIVINPNYLKLNRKMESGIEYIETETAQNKYNAYFEELARNTPVSVELLDVCQLEANETRAFNDIRLLNDWFEQQLQQDDLSLTTGYRQNEINDIADRYGTDYFLWTGVFTFKKQKKTFLYGILFDIRTGRREVVKFEYINKRDRQFLIRGHVYDMLNQIGS